MCGVERVFVSSIIERGKTHSRANISVKDFNKVRKSVNEKLKKYSCLTYSDALTCSEVFRFYLRR